MCNIRRTIETRTFKKLREISRSDTHYTFKAKDLDVVIDIDAAIVDAAVKVITENRAS